jgi:hypothetical protein
LVGGGASNVGASSSSSASTSRTTSVPQLPSGFQDTPTRPRVMKNLHGGGSGGGKRKP